MARVHGERRSAPYAGRDGICSSCKRGFHTRLRVVHHLSYSSPQCLEWCMLHCEPFTEQDREVLDREDAGQRRKDKREGRSFLGRILLLFESLEDFFVLWAVACCFSSVQSFASFTVFDSSAQTLSHVAVKVKATQTPFEHHSTSEYTQTPFNTATHHNTQNLQNH